MADILKELASSSGEGIYETVVKQALPILVEAIGSAKANESWVPSAAIDFAQSLAAGSPAEKGLGDGFVAVLAPNLFQCLDQTEDRDVLQVCSFALIQPLNFINDDPRMAYLVLP